jgi:hypothetical protein
VEDPPPLTAFTRYWYVVAAWTAVSRYTTLPAVVCAVGVAIGVKGPVPVARSTTKPVSVLALSRHTRRTPVVSVAARAVGAVGVAVPAGPARTGVDTASPAALNAVTR